MPLRILDLYCCAGGAARGYAKAGFEVMGVDISPQRHYPYPLLEQDALSVLDMLVAGEVLPFGSDMWNLRRFGLDDFDAIHASPPCQRFANLVHCRPGVAETYPDLIDPTRQRLMQTGLPYIIENVPQAPLKNPVMLCGTQFGRRFQLHRHFETNFDIPQLDCQHDLRPFNIENTAGRARMRAELGPDANLWKTFCTEKGVYDMSPDKKARREAISPIYTEYIGGVLSDIISPH